MTSESAMDLYEPFKLEVIDIAKTLEFERTITEALTELGNFALSDLKEEVMIGGSDDHETIDSLINFFKALLPEPLSSHSFIDDVLSEIIMESLTNTFKTS